MDNEKIEMIFGLPKGMASQATKEKLATMVCHQYDIIDQLMFEIFCLNEKHMFFAKHTKEQINRLKELKWKR